MALGVISRLSLAGVRANRMRFLALTLAVFIGVAFISATLTITDTVQASFNSLLGDVYRDVDVSVRERTEVIRQQTAFRGRIDEENVARIRMVPGVRAAEPIVFGYAYVVSQKGVAPPNIDSETAGAPVAQNWLEDSALNSFTL